MSNYIDDIDQLDKMNASIVFRCYATLTIFIIIDKDSESNLAILDLIQFIVQVLDKQFNNNVCEIDLVFNPEKLHYIIDEIVMDGMVISTDIEEVC